MKRILVPTDFSANARNALAYARELAKSLQAEIILFHAYHIPYVHAEMPAGMYQTAIDEAQEETQNKLQELGNSVLGKNGESAVAYQVGSRLGFAVETILSYAEEVEADMILMGTQGSNGLADVILGSITSSVIERSSLPVMAIPEGCNFQPFENWLFATNYDVADVESFKQLLTLAKPFSASIQVVHIQTGGDEVEEQQANSFKHVVQQEVAYDAISFEVIEADDVPSGIEAYTKNQQVDGLALVKRKRNFLSSLFHSSITKKLSFHSKVPLLVFQE
jgi:nucleotide-binding universal stress UspA family protein